MWSKGERKRVEDIVRAIDIDQRRLRGEAVTPREIVFRARFIVPVTLEEVSWLMSRWAEVNEWVENERRIREIKALLADDFADEDDICPQPRRGKETCVRCGAAETRLAIGGLCHRCDHVEDER